MKGKIALCTAVLLAALVVVGVAYATAPPVTFCHATPPDTAANGWGSITTDANGVAQSAHSGQHAADIIPPFTYLVNEQVGTQLQHRDTYHWSTWQNGPCSQGGFMYTCRGQQTIPVYADVPHNYPGLNMTTLFGWGATGAEVLANGCVLPPPPYVPCDTTMADPHSRAYGIPVDVGDPVWGPWSDNGDGTFTRTGTQATTTPWIEEVVDGRDGQTVCGHITGDDPGERTVEETRDGNVWVGSDADCAQASAVRYTYDPDGTVVFAENDSYTWVLPYDLESVTLFGVLIYEPQECHQDFPGCMDPEALNYDPLAEVPGGECNYTMCPWNPDIRATDADCHAPYCDWVVTTYWRCNTGNVIWSQETGVTSGEGSNFIGSAPYNRICEWCGDITPGVYHREWRSECDSSVGWDEGTWELPEWLHTLGGCPLGGRCIG